MSVIEHNMAYYLDVHCMNSVKDYVLLELMYVVIIYHAGYKHSSIN